MPFFYPKTYARPSHQGCLHSSKTIRVLGVGEKWWVHLVPQKCHNVLSGAEREQHDSHSAHYSHQAQHFDQVFTYYSYYGQSALGSSLS